MLTVYGIPNCDSCRRARNWLDNANVIYAFHDVRADGVGMDMLNRWLALVDWQKLLNTRSTTWRSLPDVEKQELNQKTVATLMINHPTLIKRPVAEFEGGILVGFSAEEYAGFSR